ncbi:HEAT repeat domain-containing protein [Streptomyces sp. NPDC002825]|uniref:HEAT repeat domain-containing protein n=1 Tax=Streptomyces sp. NPDC002825 TaxID=3154666 RepID=UPI003325BA78
MTTPIEGLVKQLDDSTGPSYDARAELIRIGSDAIPAVIDGPPSLGDFGQLTAIEVFEEVADPRCGPALITLLSSDDSTVREWSAMALARLKIDGAVEPVRGAYRACLERATPPDWSGDLLPKFSVSAKVGYSLGNTPSPPPGCAPESSGPRRIWDGSRTRYSSTTPSTPTPTPRRLRARVRSWPTPRGRGAVCVGGVELEPAPARGTGRAPP